jgi:hypothetical protein
MGIEPTLAAWEAAVLPLNYTRARPDTLQRLNSTASCDRRQIAFANRRTLKTIYMLNVFAEVYCSGKWLVAIQLGCA